MPDSGCNAIEARGITVRFGDFTAVDHIDITVRRGEIFGFLGPNGAGKTTTVKVLTTMMRPTEGKLSIEGVSTAEGPRVIRSEIGVVQQHIALDKDLSVRENIVSRAVLHKMSRKDIGPRLQELSDMIGMTPYLDKKISDLSGGWKRKAAIIGALMHSPKILFLDEPTAGLDTQSRHMLWDMIQMLNRAGVTVFVTTHYMDEAESLCGRVSIIRKGRIMETGTPKELCDRLGRFTVEYDGDSGRREYRFFSSREEAKDFFGEQESRNPVIRGTHLEDVFLEDTGRDNMKVIEKALRI